MGIAVFEGWAKDLDDAAKNAAAGAFAFHPNHHFGAVGPMTGLTTASQPLMVVENKAFGNRAYCAINEGLGKVMRFGGNDAEVLNRLRWIREVLGPALGRAIRESGGIALKPLIARGLTMGDEMHQRNVACSSLLLRQLAPFLARTSNDAGELVACLDFIGRNDQFFLNIAMAMGKALADPARDIAASSVVTAMSRNGTDFGIRVSGTGDRWFTAPVEMPVGIYFPGFSEKDANPDMGDSRHRGDGRARGLCDGGGAGRGRIYRRGARVRGRGVHAVDGGDHRRAQSRMGHSGDGLHGRADRHRYPSRRRDRARSDHQYRDRAPRARRRPGRRRHREGAAQVLPGRARGIRRDHGRRMSVILNEVRRATYLDSIVLMRISRQIAALPGVEEAGLIIGTPANKEILRDAGILGPESGTRRARAT